jgi:hypothetical protein
MQRRRAKFTGWPAQPGLERFEIRTPWLRTESDVFPGSPGQDVLYG